ncbi:RNA polymerase sigma factor [Sphingobacterium tabacisoli]|uniref:RNA polymerase sigma factor n=1 Tax=Sphingobacterium tabacisoli TaxID=2044855 RepID=A0ABW5L7R6_9SPHI|nr:sigma-70 family RNA polymerase sigma factor [Sphingobacterium tabacisoli]
MQEIAFDNELLSGLKRSERSAFNSIYEKYSSVLYKTSFKRIPDSDLCNDIIHDIFLALWENREKSNIINLKAYLFQSLRYLIIDHIQRKGKTEKLFQNYLYFLQKDYIGTDHTIRSTLLEQLIDEEVKRLPEKMRMVYLMSRQQHLSHEEIAGKLGISKDTVRAHIKQALRRLRIRLGMILFLLILITVSLFG